MNNANQYTHLKEIGDSVALVNYADEIIKDYRDTHKFIQRDGERGVNLNLIYILRDKITNKVGGLNNSGKVIIPFEYDEYKSKPMLSDGPNLPLYTFIVKNGDLQAFGDIRTGVLTDCVYSYISRINKDLIKVYKDGLLGIIDIAGKELVPPIYDTSYYDNYISEDGKLLEVSRDYYKERGVIDLNNNVIVQFDDKRVKTINSNKYFMQYQDNGYVLIDKERTVLTKKSYKEIRIINNDYAEIITKRGIHKFFDLNKLKEKLITQNKDAPVLDIVVTNYIYIDTSGEGILDIVKKDTQYQMLISDYISGIEEYYDHIKPLNNGVYKMIRDSHKPIGVSYKKGDTSLKGYVMENSPQQMQFNSEFYDEELIIVKKHDEYGVINSKNQIVIPIKYKSISKYFKDDTIKNTCFIYGLKVDVKHFENYFILRDKNDNMGLADNNGSVLFEPIYNKIVFINNVTIKIINDKKQGIINLNNEKIVEAKYESIYLIGDNIFKCTDENSRYDLYTTNGKLLGNFKTINVRLLEAHSHRDNSCDCFCILDKNINTLCVLENDKLYKLEYLTEIGDTVITFAKINDKKYIGINTSAVFSEDEFRYCIDNNILNKKYNTILDMI